MSIDGFKVKTDSPGSHLAAIDYLRKSKQIGESKINLIDDLRKKRIGITYYGKHIDPDFLRRNESRISETIQSLSEIVQKAIKS